MIFSLSMTLLPALLYRFELLDRVPHIIGLNTINHFLIGPLTYLYVKSCTIEGFEFKPKMGLHFIPFLLEILILIPFWILSGPEKYSIYLDFIENKTVFTPTYLIPIKVLHGLIYFTLAVFTIINYRKHLTEATSYIDDTFHRWLLLFVFITSLPILALICFVFIDIDKATLFSMFLVMYVLFFLLIDTAILLKPELFQTFPHRAPKSSDSVINKQKYENSNLTERQKNLYINQVKSYMTEQSPYKKPDLSLTNLSEALNIPSHYLSQVINEKMGTNFLDFINQHRVENAKAQLLNPESNHLTIMAIAYDSGFNSKSTFYSSFKKHTDMTPSEYKKAHKA